MDSIARFYANSSPFAEGGGVDDCPGWKVGYLENVFARQIRGISGVTYLFSDQFKCKKNHSQITYGCNCGFYSFKKEHNAVDLKSLNRNLIVFQVEHYGEIFEFEDGYISEEQDVTGIKIGDKCAKRFCKEKTVAMTFSKKFFIPTCKKHTDGLMYSLSELSLLLDMPVTLL